jgi:multidrug resistance protein
VHEARSTPPARGDSSGNHAWDEKIDHEDHDQSHNSNAASSKNPFETPTEKAVVNTNDNDDLESGQRTSSIQEEPSENANIVSWDGESDPENPLNWPSWRRWVLINLVSVITLMAGLSSSMFAPGVPALMVEFHSDNSTLASFVVTVFVLGFATGPLLFAPLSELYGRTVVQHTGCIGFVIFSVACALSTSLNMLIGMRLLQGIFAAVPLTNGGAIVADMVKQEERGFAMAMLILGVLIGPVIGPVTGGFLAAAKGWRCRCWGRTNFLFRNVSRFSPKTMCTPEPFCIEQLLTSPLPGVFWLIAIIVSPCRPIFQRSSTEVI